MMSGQKMGSITGWFDELNDRNPEAQRVIWERFVGRLVNFSSRKLSPYRITTVDADDIANMAFANFFQKTPRDFQKLVDRNDLWQILAMIAQRRIIDQLRREESRPSPTSIGPDNDMDILKGPFNSPSFDAILAEEFEVRLESLNDKTLKLIAVERMQGSKNKEIAEKLKVSLRSVERKLRDIRDIFESAVV